ncbi:MAG: DUF378 domain-containing protein [bacterium]|nr:DUF378 domain-containing protein [bacterium]
MDSKALHMVAWILVIVGGLNWLLVGIIGWDIGALFGGMDAVISRVIYVLVGLAAIFELVTHKKGCKKCSASATAPMAPTM